MTKWTATPEEHGAVGDAYLQHPNGSWYLNPQPTDDTAAVAAALASLPRVPSGAGNRRMGVLELCAGGGYYVPHLVLDRRVRMVGGGGAMRQATTAIVGSIEITADAQCAHLEGFEVIARPGATGALIHARTRHTVEDVYVRGMHERVVGYFVDSPGSANANRSTIRGLVIEECKLGGFRAWGGDCGISVDVEVHGCGEIGIDIQVGSTVHLRGFVEAGPQVCVQGFRVRSNGNRAFLEDCHDESGGMPAWLCGTPIGGVWQAGVSVPTAAQLAAEEARWRQVHNDPDFSFGVTTWPRPLMIRDWTSVGSCVVGGVGLGTVGLVALPGANGAVWSIYEDGGAMRFARSTDQWKAAIELPLTGAGRPRFQQGITLGQGTKFDHFDLMSILTRLAALESKS